ncbi:MAG: restriction endonuclease subunit S [Paludibacteraceae bacterium]|nr:restriction endonuclease subunit S [Paludibacteraceae bacterium]
MDTQNWSTFTLGELFNIYTGKDLIYSTLTFGEHPVIGHKAENNGITAYTEKLDGYTLYDNTQTISLGDRGNFFAAVQSKPFYIGTRVKALTFKFRSNIYILTFIATLINKEAFRFSYGRNCCDRTEHIVIKLPSIKIKDKYIPDVDYIEELTKQNIILKLPSKSREVWNGEYDNKPISSNTISLDSVKWDWFTVSDLFHAFERGKVHSQYSLPSGNEYFYVGAKKDSNGVMTRCGYDENLVSKGNCVIFICNGEGSVGYSNYMDRDFMASGDLILGYGEHINQYTGLFLSTILDKERPKYSFGRKYGKYVKGTKILLPTTKDGTPDWEFMENYIKSLPYSANI